MKNTYELFAICFLLFLLGLPVFTQELDMDCRPIPAPTQCDQIERDLRAAEAPFLDDIRDLQRELQSAPTGQKNLIAGEIRRIRLNMANDPTVKRLKQDLANCRRQFDTTPRRTVAPAVLDKIFSGTATGVTTSGLTGGSMTPTGALPFTARLQFSQNRCSVTASGFSITPFTPPGTSAVVTPTVTSGGSGSFFPVSGIFSMPMGILYNYNSPPIPNDTISVNFTTGNSVSPSGGINLTGMTLSTTPAGMTIDQCGTTVNGSLVACSVTLVGTGVFVGTGVGGAGILNRSDGGLTLTGSINPIPPPPPPISAARRQCLNACNADFNICRRDGGSILQCNKEKRTCQGQCPP